LNKWETNIPKAAKAVITLNFIKEIVKKQRN